MAKDKVKLLLNLIAAAITALPRGGEIEVRIEGPPGAAEFPAAVPRSPARARRNISPTTWPAVRPPPLDALSIQAYYTWRLAASSRMPLNIAKDGADICLIARSA